MSSSTSLQLHSEDDGCGLKSSYYRVYLGDWIPYTDPFILEDGMYTIEFYAEDNLGNNEVPTINTVGIDTQAPVITINKPRTNHLYISGREILTLPLKGNADAIILGQTKIDVQVTDRGCGVDTIHLYIDGELRHKSFDGGALSFNWNKRSIGIHTCEIWTQDMLGNSYSEQFKIWMLNI
jgi:hypothetical protein